MKTEISRDSHQPEKRYSGVYQQQGRMLTDADWNELVDILKGRLNDALKDVVGSKEGSFGGAPRHRGLKVIKADPADPLTIEQGQVFVDGCQAAAKPDPAEYPADDPPPAVFEYDKQLDFPSPPALPADATLYVDVWERTVTHLMDERLRDKGLRGADTCTRQQTMAQVKWCPKDIDPEQSAKNPAKGDALLTVTLLKKTTRPDPCDPCAAQLDVASRIGNYLFRVEVHDVEGDADSATGITLKWSSENGSEHYALKDAEDGDVEPPGSFKGSMWAYEFFDDVSERHLGVHLAPGFSPSREALTAGYPAAVPARSFVRRWDGYCVLKKEMGNWTVGRAADGKILGFDRGAALQDTDSGALGFIDIDTGTDGLSRLVAKLTNTEVKLALTKEGSETIKDCAFVAGDFWLADVREDEHTAGSVLIETKAPRGIAHHYLALGEVSGGKLDNDPEFDRKYAFPPLTEMTRLFMAGGDGQEVMPGQPLPQALRVGVANGEWPVGGATVRFQIEAGGGSLSPVNGGITSVDGIAECVWTPGSALGDTPRVKATLIDPDHADDANDDMAPPVYFYANLITADQVAYAPGCPDSGQNAVHSLLAADAAVSLDLGADDYYTVKEVLDALLCKLKARHIPYDPTNLSRWEDINEEEGGSPPDTVQKAVDALLENLHSEDVTYLLPACSPDTNTLKDYLLTYIEHDSRDASGRYRLQAMWNALLCHLDAAKLPYNPNQSPDTTLRWRDINEQPGTGDIDEPNTVQEAIDDLIIGLESRDITYEVPSGCGTAASPTVRSGLGIAVGTQKISEILDKLLCDFRATHLPVDKTDPELCDKLKNDGGVKTVQDAIKALCSQSWSEGIKLHPFRREQGGGPKELQADEVIGIDDFVNGLAFATKDPLDPRSINQRAVGTVSLEVPYTFFDSTLQDRWQQYLGFGYKPIILAGEFSLLAEDADFPDYKNVISWVPSFQTKAWMRAILSNLLLPNGEPPLTDQLLVRVSLNGNLIWGGDSRRLLYIDPIFGTPTAAWPIELGSMPNGGGRPGDSFEFRFYIANQKGLEISPFGILPVRGSKFFAQFKRAYSLDLLGNVFSVGVNRKSWGNLNSKLYYKSLPGFDAARADNLVNDIEASLESRDIDPKTMQFVISNELTEVAAQISADLKSSTSGRLNLSIPMETPDPVKAVIELLDSGAPFDGVFAGLEDLHRLQVHESFAGHFLPLLVTF